jgi:hypothetical protein
VRRPIASARVFLHGARRGYIRVHIRVHDCADARLSQSQLEHTRVSPCAHSMCLLLRLVPQDIKLLGNLIAVDLAVVFPVQPLKNAFDAL